MSTTLITIDGSVGEGGGQMLRTSLALSVITGQPFRMTNIRANRRKPGLMRQHVACVKAAAEICGGEAIGAEVNSSELDFRPGIDGVRAGNYKFAIGSAGSTSLVIQTILLPLVLAKGTSRVTVTGGTCNPMAPPFQFLDQVFLPLLARMGADVTMAMECQGFVPVGGGIIHLEINGIDGLQSLDVLERGAVLELKAEGFRAGQLPGGIVERELAVIAKRLPIESENLLHRFIDGCDCAGNYVAITVRSENITEVFTAVGEIGKRAETVANECVNETRSYLAADVPVGPHLADQLLLPMALAGGGSFITGELSTHTVTNIEMIKCFLPVEIVVGTAQKGRPETAVITIKKAGDK